MIVIMIYLSICTKLTLLWLNMVLPGSEFKGMCLACWQGQVKSSTCLWTLLQDTCVNMVFFFFLLWWRDRDHKILGRHYQVLRFKGIPFCLKTLVLSAIKQCFLHCSLVVLGLWIWRDDPSALSESPGLEQV